MNITASVTPNATRFGPLLYPGELDRAVHELAGLGYTGIELSLRTPEDIDKRELYAQLDRHGLVLSSIATGQSYLEDGYSLFAEDSGIRRLTTDRIKRFIELVEPFRGAVILGGIKGALTGTDREKQYAGGCDAIDSCLEYAEKHQVTLLLEAINRYETNLFNTVEACLDFAEQRNSPYLKILPDTFHMNIEEVSMEDSLQKAAPYIGAIHCADSNRLAPGMGHLDFSSLLRDTAAYTSLRYLGVEVLPLPDSRVCAETAINSIRTCLAGIRAYVSIPSDERR